MQITPIINDGDGNDDGNDDDDDDSIRTGNVDDDGDGFVSRSHCKLSASSNNRYWYMP